MTMLCEAMDTIGEIGTILFESIVRDGKTKMWLMFGKYFERFASAVCDEQGMTPEELMIDEILKDRSEAIFQEMKAIFRFGTSNN